MPHLGHPVLQLAPDPVSQGINLANHPRLILQLAAHVIRLLPQIPNSPKHPIQLLILLMHQLDLALLLHLGVVIVPGPSPLLVIIPRLEIRRTR